jgi:hypothetical protein
METFFGEEIKFKLKTERLWFCERAPRAFGGALKFFKPVTEAACNKFRVRVNPN